MSVFFTDSNSELWYDKLEQLGLEYISMPYTLDGIESGYDLGKTHNFDAFFAKIKQGVMPKTSALSPQNYVDIFEPWLKQGKDILYVHFSEGLSATFNFMRTAIEELKETYPERTIKYVDTKNISLGAGLIAYKAALLHNQGASDDEVIEFVKQLRDKVHTYFMVSSLQHLRRGGRVSSTKAVIGGVLNIKPILNVTKEGKLESFGKASGVKKAIFDLAQKVELELDQTYDCPIGILHADAKQDAELLKQKVQEIAGADHEVWLQDVGPTVGTHCGPGTLGIAFVAKESK